MSISKSIGGMNNFLNNVRMSNTYNKMKDDYRSFLQHGKLGESVYKATKYVKDFVKRGFMNDTISSSVLNSRIFFFISSFDTRNTPHF